MLLREKNFDLEKFEKKMICDGTEAVVTYFEPVKKKREGVEVKHLEVGSYEMTTRNGMVKVKNQVNDRFDIDHVVIIQRVGVFEPGEKLRGVLVSAPKRGEAVEALGVCLELFETHVPLQKKVVTVEGREYWVQRDDDLMELYGQVAEDL